MCVCVYVCRYVHTQYIYMPASSLLLLNGAIECSPYSRGPGFNSQLEEEMNEAVMCLPQSFRKISENYLKLRHDQLVSKNYFLMTLIFHAV